MGSLSSEQRNDAASVHSIHVGFLAFPFFFFFLVVGAVPMIEPILADPPIPPSASAILITRLLLVGVIVGTVMIGYLMSSFLWGAGYQPVSRKALSRMTEFSEPLTGRSVFDLGSGFGRIVLELARSHEAFVTGVEVDPLKAWWTRLEIRRAGLQGRARVLRENLLATDLSRADVVFVFLWPGLMAKIREKALLEMKPGSLIVSYEHRLTDWEPERVDKELHVFLYRIPDRP
jgi:hypothetical protein